MNINNEHISINIISILYLTTDSYPIFSYKKWINNFIQKKESIATRIVLCKKNCVNSNPCIKYWWTQQWEQRSSLSSLRFIKDLKKFEEDEMVLIFNFLRVTLPLDLFKDHLHLLLVSVDRFSSLWFTYFVDNTHIHIMRQQSDISVSPSPILFNEKKNRQAYTPNKSRWNPYELFSSSLPWDWTGYSFYFLLTCNEKLWLPQLHQIFNFLKLKLLSQINHTKHCFHDL